MAKNSITYDDAFYANRVDTAGSSADVIAPMVQAMVGSKRVVDVGCGDGSWLAAFKACGAEAILGLDGEWLDEKVLRIPRETFRRADLFGTLDIEERFDLAISLEVAEHLPYARAASFVQDLCGLAPVILFSAAIPLQGGTNHFNEQWASYWAAHFARNGYVPVDAIRMRIWAHSDVTWWYKQNTLIYVDEQKIGRYPDLHRAYELFGGEVRDIVHPEKYRAIAKQAQPSFGRWLKMLPQTFRGRQKI